ncbi:ligand-binding sensor domain-containing diguanylate cyclase [Arenimonas aestuarii]
MFDRIDGRGTPGATARLCCACLLAALVCLSPASAVASIGVPLVETVDDDDAIQNDIVTALAQDHNGFLWIGTQNGLLRYDGYRFRRFVVLPKEDPSTSGVFVRRLWVSEEGWLWIGTNADGAAVMNPDDGKVHNFKADPQDPGSLSSGRVDAFASDGEGGVWVGTDDGLYHLGADELDGSGNQRLHRHGDDGGRSGRLSNPHVRSLLLDHQKRLWVGTWDGVSLLPPGGGELRNVGADDEDGGLLAGQEIWALAQAPDGRIWWGGRTRGAGWIDPESGTITALPLGTADGIGHPWIANFAFDQDGRLWAGSYGAGVDVLDPASGRILQRFRHQPAMNTTLAGNTTGALLADRAGLMWIGNWGGGLQHVNTRNKAFRMVRHVPGDETSLSSEDVFALLELDDGTVWAGTNGNGIDLLDLERGRIGGIRPEPGTPGALPDGAVISLAKSSDGTVWVGTRQAGLLRYDPAQRRFQPWAAGFTGGEMQVQRLLVDAQGIVWVGTNSGLLRVDPVSQDTRRYVTDRAPDERFAGSVGPMAITPDGTLWVGTDTGLYALAPGAEQLRTILIDPRRDDSLSSNDVNGLVVDARGDLWAATARGIDRFIGWDGPAARFESINTRVGLPPGQVASNLVLADDGRVWDVGVVVDLEAGTLDKFSRPEGFDIGGGWIGAYTRTRDGRLLFGGPRGIAVVRPQAYARWDYAPPVMVSSLWVDGEPVAPPVGVDPLLMPPQSRGFSVEFAALDYSSPDNLAYAYLLEGYEPNWTEVNAERRVATFTNLDPGRYTLRVKASNRVGAWSPETLALRVHVEPEFHETVWFRSLALLAGLLALYLVFIARTRRLAARALALEALVRERTESLANANDELAALARTDPLTGLANRRAFIEVARAEIARSRRSGQSLSIVLADIDHFKNINDRHGHDVGDAVLKAVAATLAGNKRAQDTVARWGGEELIFLLPETDLAAAAEVAEKWRKSVSATEVGLGQATVSVTLTLGVAEVRPDSTLEHCIARADAALYDGKRAGRDRVVSAGDDAA